MCVFDCVFARLSEVPAGFELQECVQCGLTPTACWGRWKELALVHQSFPNMFELDARWVGVLSIQLVFVI